MELLPNDVRMLIYRDLHRCGLTTVLRQMSSWLKWNDMDKCLIDVTLGYNSEVRAFGWRHLDLTLRYQMGPIYTKSKQGHMIVSDYRLPARYR